MSGSTEKYSSSDREEEKEVRAQKLRAYWRANTTLIRNLLIVWGFVSLGCSILFVPLLNHVRLGGVPLGFWMAQQGSIFTFVILIFVYAIKMDKLDRKYRRK